MDTKKRPAQALARARSSLGKGFERGNILGAILRFLARSAGWTVVLLLMGLAAPYTGVEIPVNPYSVAACGALGVPGLGLVLCAAAMFV